MNLLELELQILDRQDELARLMSATTAHDAQPFAFHVWWALVREEALVDEWTASEELWARYVERLKVELAIEAAHNRALQKVFGPKP